jgi:ribonuclease VapC
LSYIFDACALIALLNEEKGEGYEVVAELFDRAEAGKITLCMSIVNLCEVYYGYIRNDGKEEADRIMKNVACLPLNIINTISETVYREASLFKGTYPLSLGDAFLCGTAKSTGAIIVTKDSEIRKPEQAEGLTVLWINQ